MVPTEAQGHLTDQQLLLMEIRDKLCGGNTAQLARALDKDPTYIHRLFYPEGKAGRKGIGLEIMQAALKAFQLPLFFWSLKPPAIPDKFAQNYLSLKAARDRAAHGMGPGPFQGKWSDPNYAPQGPIIVPGNHDIQWPTTAQDPTVLVEGTTDREFFLSAARGLVPILAWDHPDDLPEGDFVMVPRLDVKLSAGAGKDQVEIDLVKENPQAFRTEWIRLMRLKPNKLAAMRASGDSMEPTIHDGDSLLVDTGQAAVKDGKVYALWYDGGERVKRLFRLPGGGLRIKSDNPAHETIDLTPEYAGHVRVIGRVVHRSGIGGL